MLPVYTYIALLFIALGIISLSLVLFYGALVDHTNYKIESRKQVYKRFGVLMVMFVFLLSILGLRFLRQNYQINLYEKYDEILEKLEHFAFQDIIILVLFAIVILIFIFLLLQTLYNNVRKSVVILFLYFHQYYIFRKFCSWFSAMQTAYVIFLINRVCLFTKNPNIVGLARNIWPVSLEILERNLFFGVMPYFLVYDLFVNYGVFCKVFQIMPWFFIYSTIRGMYLTLDKLNTFGNKSLSFDLYGFR